ncbi:septation protein SepH [Corynebacterium heidelbergense]|uniref:DUF3071 domain-containing protein n=1 Tax=Corynebacterium heidelbergense TaxID=2055947 RepID=A0A364V4Q6_9CORY|nr:septation protein SepH [Corynebacterium heidelbergense]RAV31612.1 DUF3071 domain-containing protein [Corynebacterium heidelbergense]
MQELVLVPADSDANSVVLRSLDGTAEFFLPVTDALRRIIGDAHNPASTSAAPDAEPPLTAVVSSRGSIGPADASPAAGAEHASRLRSSASSSLSPATDPATDPASDPETDPAAGSADNLAAGSAANLASGSAAGSAAGTTAETTADTATETSATTAGALDRVQREATADPTAVTTAGTDDPAHTSPTAGHSPARNATEKVEDSSEQPGSRGLREVGFARRVGVVTEKNPTTTDHQAPQRRRNLRPRRSRISIPPRDIQDRVRHGATVAELAREADTDESRIEPYAWPILQERARIAELARSAHPITAQGPATETLWESLATTFAARGEKIRDAHWDAHQNEMKQWVVTVSWNKTAAGQESTHVAEFGFTPEAAGPNVVQPLNSIAGDLVDPRFGQPVRAVSPVTSLSSAGSAENRAGAHGGLPGSSGWGTGDHAPNGTTVAGDSNHNGSGEPEEGADLGGEGASGGAGNSGDRGNRNEGGDQDEDGFLQHPAAEREDKPRRKRKAVTPHWEDVLLGVRTNPRKKQ